MNNYLHIIKKSTIFDGLIDKEINAMLRCLDAKKKQYGKGQYILCAGDNTELIGLLLEGSSLIIQEDFWGNRNILGKVTPSKLFAEAFACSPGIKLNVSVIAEEDCTVLWLDVHRIIKTCPSACLYHTRIIQNLLTELAKKNLQLNDKLTHMGQRLTREKILSYLSSQVQKNNNREVYIPFNRQQLADYLSVERSALSVELSKLRDDGIIDFDKNHFVIK